MNPVSSIVRGMVKYCGAKEYTTYSCFCTDSSSEVNSLISQAVKEKCGLDSQARSAMDVFHEYCEVGTITNQALPTATPSTNTSNIVYPTSVAPSPANTASSSQPLQTSRITMPPPPGNFSLATLSIPNSSLLLSFLVIFCVVVAM
ncbi:hypothetical protein B0O99DRAFT_691634 [Bisporella sp. PMI_857]|nr:hypothetical protein B0O99DRAFT_691634 [Bisporella sp. PMI_857]